MQSNSEKNSKAGVLTDICVLDLSRVRSGPTCVRQLCDWGARVIKIEQPDDSSEMGGPRNGPDFQNLHRGKESLTLNLKSQEGLQIFHQLVKKADIVVENFRPDVKYKLGLDYQTLANINQAIILVSISGFGQDGPYKDRPGFDQVAQGISGLMSVTGEPGEGPMRVGIPLADLSAGLFAAQGVLLALYERINSGKGQWVQTSLLQSQIFMLDFQAARYAMNGEIPKQAGNNHPTSIPTGVFKTKDGFMNIAASGEVIWQKLAKAFDHPEWISDNAFATAEARSLNREKLGDAINVCTVNKTTADWIDLLNQQGVPCGPIYSIDQMFADPQVQHLEVSQSVVNSNSEKITVLSQPICLSRTQNSLYKAAPLAGEHTQNILRELGYSQSEITNLRDKKTI
ncbi:CoA transferase [Alphaproteobacteria bacterium]|nr:CoA transferase [Alphaproteobacteria bacterium]